MRVLVTGATGYLGGATVDALRAAGVAVRALARASSDASALLDRGVDVARAPLLPSHASERDALRAALQGVAGVAHLAGGGRVRRAADFFRNNTATTEHLADAIRDTPSVRRVVFVSSMAARGPAPSDDPAASHVTDAPITDYGRAKRDAEQVLRALEDERDLAVTVLRPPGIYGPGDDRMLPLFRAAQRGLVPLPAAGRTASFVYIDDCASAIVHALTSAHVDHHAYYPEDGTPQSTEAMARAIAEAVGSAPRILRVPSPILHSAAALSELAARARRAPLLFTRDKARDLVQAHWVCDATPFREDTGWRPTTPLEEGLERAAADYRARGWIA